MTDGEKITRTLGRETGESIPLRRLRALFDDKKGEEASFHAYWSYGPPRTHKNPITLNLAGVLGVLVASGVVAMLLALVFDASGSLLLDVFLPLTLLSLPVLVMLMLIHSEVEKWPLRRLRRYYRKAHLSSDAYEKALRLLPDDPAYAEAFHMLVAERLERRSAGPLPSLDTVERTERWVKWVLNPIIVISSYAVFLTGIMVLVSLAALGRWVSNSRTLHWQPAPAQVVVFDPLTCHKGRGQHRRKEQGIYYQYQWNGQTYLSDTFANSGNNSTLEDCGEEVIDAMKRNWSYTTDPPQLPVTAYVNPDEPSMAVLMRGGGKLAPQNLFSLLFIPSILLSSWASRKADKLSKEKGFD